MNRWWALFVFRFPFIRLASRDIAVWGLRMRGPLNCERPSCRVSSAECRFLCCAPLSPAFSSTKAVTEPIVCPRVFSPSPILCHVAYLSSVRHLSFVPTIVSEGFLCGQYKFGMQTFWKECASSCSLCTKKKNLLSRVPSFPRRSSRKQRLQTH